VLVGRDEFLIINEVRNVSRRPGHFDLHKGDRRLIERSAVVLGFKPVGTFHSHVASDPIPSRGDVEGADPGELMLILDATTDAIALWRIGKKRATAMAYRLV